MRCEREVCDGGRPRRNHIPTSAWQSPYSVGQSDWAHDIHVASGAAPEQNVAIHSALQLLTSQAQVNSACVIVLVFAHGLPAITPMRTSAHPTHVAPLDDDDDDELLLDDELLELELEPPELEPVPPVAPTGGGTPTPSALGPGDSLLLGPRPSISTGPGPPEHATKSPAKATAIHKGFMEKRPPNRNREPRSLRASVRNSSERERSS